MANTRYIGGTSPIISVTKWHDLETGEFYFDLYINGKIDGRYSFSELTKKFQELMLEV